ncbi:GAF domain-containing protein [Marinoscillum sp.]|uniref:GAF domain-containing protein n=1 Tax=Marinoscillum sp. TaxID=2024838 RepID=UPI003BAC0D38
MESALDARFSSDELPFTRELLAEAEDEQLMRIVNDAAKKLKTPIALVTVVMEQLQFFKAHYGLPEDLAKSRGTDKDVSFCQFVVTTEQPLELVDAQGMKGIPQQIVEEYGIRAYLGMPIKSNNTVIGSLCVLDTEPHAFSEEEKENLKKLADLVNERLAELNKSKRKDHSNLIGKAASPALKEAMGSIKPIKSSVSEGMVATRELSTFLRIIEMTLYGEPKSKNEIRKMLEDARSSLERCENGLYDIEASIEDTEDSLEALGHVFQPTTSTMLSEVAESGRELARHVTKEVGGVLLPELEFDPQISTPRTLGSSIVALTLTLVANGIKKAGNHHKIRMSIEDQEVRAALIIACEDLSEAVLGEIVRELKNHTAEEPTITFKLSEGSIQLLFSVVKSRY